MGDKYIAYNFNIETIIQIYIMLLENMTTKIDILQFFHNNPLKYLLCKYLTSITFQKYKALYR